jgi:hypothetical protein
MNETLQFLITTTTLGVVIGVPLGWCIRSLLVSREIQRAHRDAWKHARTIYRHGGEV